MTSPTYSVMNVRDQLSDILHNLAQNGRLDKPIEPDFSGFESPDHG
jgi:hypothetical protein